MKNIAKIALVAASALAVASSAHAAYHQGDLLVGFTGGTSDTIYDLGQFSTLVSGETWNVGSSLGTSFGVIGASSTANGSHIYSTSSDSAQNGYAQQGNYTLAKGDIGTIAGSLTGIGQSRNTTPTDTTGWTSQTDQPPGTPGNTFQNDFYNPNVGGGSQAFLFVNSPFEAAGTADGYFTYSGSTLTFNVAAVPEPATYGVIAGFGLLALALRRQFVKA
jgi:hypothetical protein